MSLGHKKRRVGMKPITVVDARMGRGKSTAAIRYMNQWKDEKRFLYITPYLDEVGRICEMCDFEQAGGDKLSKSIELKMKMLKGENISATHALLQLMDAEALEIAKSQNYSIIIDESIDVVRKMDVSRSDMEFIGQSTIIQDDETLKWKNKDYIGRFSEIKNAADAGSLAILDGTLFKIMDPDMFEMFDEVFMLTYLFDGQYQKAYLDYFEMDYKVIGVEYDHLGGKFSDKVDCPEPIDYSALINLVTKHRMNDVADNTYALSKSWYVRRGRNHPDVKLVRNRLRSFFRNSEDGGVDSRIWTTFLSDRDKLIGSDGRYRNNFVQINARATNNYRTRKDVAYMANRFADPNVLKFFAKRGIQIDRDDFALSEMLQWIWRSAIRDGNPINLYIPSKRMRKLFLKWLETANTPAKP